MIAIFNNQGSGGNGSAITQNGLFCAIAIPAPASDRPGETAGAPLITEASYLIVAGSTGVGTVVTFQELGADGTWRSLASPAPITLTDSGNYNGPIAGQFHGLQIAASALVGNGIQYAELKGLARP